MSMNRGESLAAPLENSRDKWLKVEAIILAALLVLVIAVTNYLVRESSNAAASVKLMTVDGLIAGHSLEVAGTTPNLVIQRQDVAPFKSDQWTVQRQIFAPINSVGGFVEFKLPNTVKAGHYRLLAYMTRALDYGVVQLSLDGKEIGPRIDLYATTVTPIGPLDMGLVDIGAEQARLRIAVVDRNASANAPFYQFGFQGIVLKAE